MAEAVRFQCGHCGRAIVAWSDGNPYYLDSRGSKQYAYHPDHERLARCIGNDSPHLGLACGEKVLVDSRAPVEACPHCEAVELADCNHLGGCRCPYCKAGVFHIDPDFHCIS